MAGLDYHIGGWVRIGVRDGPNGRAALSYMGGICAHDGVRH
jgi:hypothetical protein